MREKTKEGRILNSNFLRRAFVPYAAKLRSLTEYVRIADRIKATKLLTQTQKNNVGQVAA
jgi:hypothetical protein